LAAWAWVKRRQAVEPVIGHLKDYCRLRRCHLKGAEGDALHVIARAAGYNIRWLLRWTALLCAWIREITCIDASRRQSMEIACPPEVDSSGSTMGALVAHLGTAP